MVKKKNKEEKLVKKKEVEESEEKIDETKEDEEKPKIVESFLKSIPLFGDFFKELGKTEVFKKRFEEANKQIQENLQKGERKGWGFQAHISTRPIMKDKELTKKEESSEAIFVGKDYWYAQKRNILVLAIKVPSENIEIKLENKNLKLKDEKWEKDITLPDIYRTIRKKQYKKGFLALELEK